MTQKITFFPTLSILFFYPITLPCTLEEKLKLIREIKFVNPLHQTLHSYAYQIPEPFIATF